MSINSALNIKDRIVMVILAAGNSSRMGAVKQLLPWKNSTLLINAIEVGLASKVTDVVVVLGANSEKIRPSINNFDIGIVENKDWKSGLGASISCAIKHIKEKDMQFDAVLFCLADMPFLEVSHLNKMIETYKPNKKSIIATRLKDKVMVPALFDAVYYKDLLKLTGDSGAKKLLKQHQNYVELIEVKSKKTLVDLDTQRDYDFYKKGAYHK